MPGKTVSRTDRRTRYTRKVIKDAYLELLGEMQPQKVTVTEVCRRAEINRGTFYIHYEDLPQVMEELENEAFDELVVFINKSLADESNRQNLSNDFFMRHIHSWTTKINLFDSFYTERLYGKVEEYAESLLVELCIATGKLGKPEAELFAAFMVNACFRAVRKLCESPEEDLIERNAFINHLVGALFDAVIDPREINAVFELRS